MITYQSICEKLGFDPIAENEAIYNNTPSYEDDSIENPFSKLSLDEVNYFIAYATACINGCSKA